MTIPMIHTYPVLSILLIGLNSFAAAESGGFDAEHGTFEARLREAVSQRNHFEMASRMFPTLRELDQGNLKRAVAIVEGHANKLLRAQTFDLLLRYWAMFDPKGALAYDLGEFADLRSSYLVSGILQTWATYDPTNAIEWAETIPADRFFRSPFPGDVP